MSMWSSRGRVSAVEMAESISRSNERQRAKAAAARKLDEQRKVDQERAKIHKYFEQFDEAKADDDAEPFQFVTKLPSGFVPTVAYAQNGIRYFVGTDSAGDFRQLAVAPKHVVKFAEQQRRKAIDEVARKRVERHRYREAISAKPPRTPLKVLSRADFRYRESNDAAKHCGTCRDYTPDRSPELARFAEVGVEVGTCGLYAGLRKRDPQQYNLHPDTMPGFRCTGFRPSAIPATPVVPAQATDASNSKSDAMLAATTGIVVAATAALERLAAQQQTIEIKPQITLPAITVSVPPPPPAAVTLQPTINVPPAEVRVEMPRRKVVKDVSYDDQGNVKRVVETEQAVDSPAQPDAAPGSPESIRQLLDDPNTPQAHKDATIADLQRAADNGSAEAAEILRSTETQKKKNR